jgi:hypothetical protein
VKFSGRLFGDILSLEIIFKKLSLKILQGTISPYLCNPKMEREFSSVGLEHLPYKQRVRGSNPRTPTEASQKCGAFLI